MSNRRKAISPTLRFEVFKRDAFTCQYCGAKAPDVVLNCDHIHPVAEGGKNEILNLITACKDCNGGKGARKLDDRSALVRQRSQIEELEARREQLEMMLRWRDEAERGKLDVVEQIALRIGERGGFEPNENGRLDIRRWIKRFSAEEVLAAVDESFDRHMSFGRTGKPQQPAWEFAFKQIPVMVGFKRRAAERPYLPRLAYTQGILRRRFADPHFRCMEALEEYLVATSAPDWIICDAFDFEAKRATSWDDFSEGMHAVRTTLESWEEEARGKD